ncbi:MAG: DNA-directed RNA polymerase subunit alpha [Planctomycetes bacterium]|nr:DNA-directed RNA polymerase subunit alpha [Planctomycetota bacterium]
MLRVRWKSFELPSRVLIDEQTETQNYAKFIIEPFEKGFGYTIGNSLRRVLYASIEGTAIISVKIKGAAHEFSTIEGVNEDVVDLLLNLKQLCIRFEDDVEEQTLKIKANKKKVVTGADVECPPGIKVLNLDQKVCTLTSEVDFDCSIHVKKGRGFIPSEELKAESDAGTIFLDANFSPVKRVKYSVEATRVGRRTDYDRLVLEIWTNAIVTPREALGEASKILRKHLNPFVQQFELGKELIIRERKEEEIRMRERRIEDIRRKLQMNVQELDLSVRAYNCLSSENITTVAELVVKTEQDLLNLKNFGKTSLKEVKRKLSEQGISLGMNIEEYLPVKV